MNYQSAAIVADHAEGITASRVRAALEGIDTDRLFAMGPKERRYELTTAIATSEWSRMEKRACDATGCWPGLVPEYIKCRHHRRMEEEMPVLLAEAFRQIGSLEGEDHFTTPRVTSGMGG